MPVGGCHEVVAGSWFGVGAGAGAGAVVAASGTCDGMFCISGLVVYRLG